MNIEKAFQIGQYAAYKGKPRVCPLDADAKSITPLRRAWFNGFDNEMAGQRFDRGVREEPIL